MKCSLKVNQGFSFKLKFELGNEICQLNLLNFKWTFYY